MPKRILKVDLVPSANPSTPPLYRFTLQDTTTSQVTSLDITIPSEDFGDPDALFTELCGTDATIIGCG